MPKDRLPGDPVPAVYMTLPNAVTLVRLCAVPAAVWLIMHQRLDLAFWVFVAAGLADALDGWLARVLGAHSAVGAVLDPLADKALLVSCYVALAIIGVLPDWLAMLVVFRDVLIVGGVLVLYVLGAPPRIRPLVISKANTALQVLLAAAALLIEGYQMHRLDDAIPLLVWLVAASTVASGIAYVLTTMRRGTR